MAPPPRRSGGASPAAKAVAQYLQKGVTNLSSTIFGRQSKTWARRLGLSSVLLSGLLYGAAVLANPGAPLPTNGLEVLQALSKGTKKRRGFTSLPLSGNNMLTSATQTSAPAGDIDRITNAALLDHNVNILYQQQPHLIPIIEHLIHQEQLQQQQNSLFSQRSLNVSPIEIMNVQDSDSGANQESSRRAGPSQAIYTLQALPGGLYVGGKNANNDNNNNYDNINGQKVTFRNLRR